MNDLTDKLSEGAMRAAKRHYAFQGGRIAPYDSDGFEWLEGEINKLATIIDEETRQPDWIPCSKWQPLIDASEASKSGCWVWSSAHPEPLFWSRGWDAFYLDSMDDAPDRQVQVTHYKIIPWPLPLPPGPKET